MVPEEQNRLADCLYAGYQQATRRYHRPEGSRALDTLYWHSFRGIAPETPGAISAMDFRADDAVLLLERQDLLAQGIVNGVLCLLEGSD